MADIALEVPGYGGHFIDDDGVLNVWLLDDQKREVVKSVFRQRREANILAGLDDNHLANLRSRQGHYSFLQLYNWKATLRNSVLGMKGVTSLDINEVQNNITIGVEDLTYKEDVLEKVRQTGLPEVAINFVKWAPVVQDLKEKRKDLAGGLQYQFKKFDPILNTITTESCTLGPVARRNGVKGFIVNSHCSDNQFELDNEKYYQAKIGQRHIATEMIDPSTFTGSPCPPGKECAYADAAFAKKINGHWELGRIYETEYSGHNSGSTDAIGDNFIVTSAGPYYLPNTLDINKIGIGAGWTTGDYINTCMDAELDQNKTLLCQFTADYGSARGDSGSPVFTINSPLQKTVHLVGIHWGHDPLTGESIFSPIQQVEDHLGGTIDFY